MYIKVWEVQLKDELKAVWGLPEVPGHQGPKVFLFFHSNILIYGFYPQGHFMIQENFGGVRGSPHKFGLQMEVRRKDQESSSKSHPMASTPFLLAAPSCKGSWEM